MKACVCLLVFVSAIVALGPARGDSPITSTHFCEAYMDYPIVLEASKLGTMTEEIARYLIDDNPIDVKAAVVNALSWEFEGKDNADLYCAIRYPGQDGPPDPEDMEGDEALVLAYLLVMDDYFNPDRALPYAEHARDTLSASFTAALIHALIAAQVQMDKDWGPLWGLIDNVISDESLNGDMRLGALDIITEYMVLYEQH